MEYVWDMHGLCMGCEWIIRGGCMEYELKLHRICIENRQNMQGIRME